MSLSIYVWAPDEVHYVIDGKMHKTKKHLSIPVKLPETHFECVNCIFTYNIGSRNIVLPNITCEFLQVTGTYKEARACARILNVPFDRLSWMVYNRLGKIKNTKNLKNLREIVISSNPKLVVQKYLPNMQIDIANLDNIMSEIPMYMVDGDLRGSEVRELNPRITMKVRWSGELVSDLIVNPQHILDIFPNLTCLKVKCGHEPKAIIDFASDKLTSLDLDVKNIKYVNFSTLPNLLTFTSTSSWNSCLPDLANSSSLTNINVRGVDTSDIVIRNTRSMKSARN